MTSEATDKSSFLYRLRHSMAHVMAQAVAELYNGVKLGFGPPTENGFYYDFDFGTEQIGPETLAKIEKQMRKILSQNEKFTREEFKTEQALQKASQMNQPYKEIQIKKLSGEGVELFSFYSNGKFTDLCEGPHVDSHKDLRSAAFCLDRISGAYWLGSEKNKMLTRIYALCYETEEELKSFLEQRKRAEERDHKKLGKELEIFTISETVGKGLVLWLPNGTVIREEIEKYAKEMEFRYGYHRVATPHITREELFIRSQHLPAYSESMFPPMTVEDEGGIKERFYLKPMNCPFHHLIYSSRPRSYRELPLRLAEYGTCYRFEQSGELSGLLRVRCMTMNDAHIYCPEEKLDEEIALLMTMYQEFYNTFGLKNYTYRLSIRGKANREKFKGSPDLWDRAEKILSDVLSSKNIPFYVGEGEAAFYGPKIDIQFKNLMGREETVSTIQVDFFAPVNFNLEYVSQTGEIKQPVIIHRAPLSTHERFVSFLIETYGGAFPIWMAPVQVKLIPVSDEVKEYVINLEKELKTASVRAESDFTDNTFNKKIRTAVTHKIPVCLIIGNKEASQNRVTVRRYGIKEQETLTKDDFVKQLKEEITERRCGISSFPA